MSFQNKVQIKIQVLLVDSDGSGSAAKDEVNALKKGISKINGVSNVVVTTSGRPLNSSGLTGGAIFGVIFACVVAMAAFGFVYKVSLS